MICDNCKKEKVDTLIVDGLEYQRNTREDFVFAEVVIPDGWRLPTITESIKIFENKDIWKFISRDNKWWWTSEKIDAWGPVGVGGYDPGLVLIASNIRWASRGVLLIREVNIE